MIRPEGVKRARSEDTWVDSIELHLVHTASAIRDRHGFFYGSLSPSLSLSRSFTRTPFTSARAIHSRPTHVHTCVLVTVAPGVIDNI